MDMWCARDGSSDEEEFNISISGNCIVIIPQFTLSHLVCVTVYSFYIYSELDSSHRVLNSECHLLHLSMSY